MSDELLKLFEGLTPSQVETFKNRIIPALEELKADILKEDKISKKGASKMKIDTESITDENGDYNIGYLLKKVASKLAGCSVTIETEESPDAYAKAGVKSNSFYIVVSRDVANRTWRAEDQPYQQEPVFLDAFLHECAHVRRHKDDLLNGFTGKAGKFSDLPREQEMEMEASTLGDLWTGYANAHAFEYADIIDTRESASDFKRQLVALMKIPDDVQKLYDKKVFQIQTRFRPEGGVYRY